MVLHFQLQFVTDYKQYITRVKSFAFIKSSRYSHDLGTSSMIEVSDQSERSELSSCNSAACGEPGDHQERQISMDKSMSVSHLMLVYV